MARTADCSREEAALLRAAVDGSRLLIMVVEASGQVCRVNPAVESMTGLSRQQACARRVWELVAVGEERALVEALFRPFRPEALPSGMLFHLIGGAPTPAVVLWDVHPVYDEAGAAPRVVFSGVAVSERLALEHSLLERATFQRQILDRIPAIIWATDRELRFTFSAGGGLVHIGLASGEAAVLGTTLFEYFHTTDPTHPGIAPHLRALAGESTESEIRWHDRQFQTRIDPFRDPQGNIVGCIGIAFDVTAQALSKQALTESEARFRRLFEANVIGIVFWDAAGRITDANEAFLELSGYSRDDLRSGALSWREMTPPEYRSRDNRALAEIRARGSCAPYEKQFFVADGSRVPVLVGGATLGDPGDEVRTGVAFVLDLREQVRLRQARDELLAKEHAARIESELANARLLLLAEGSARLGRCLVLSDTLETLSAIVVPALADWSYVVHRGWNGGVQLVAATDADPCKRELVRRLQSCAPDLGASDAVGRAFRTGEVALYENITAEQLSGTSPERYILGTGDPECLSVVRELGMRSILCVPIAGRAGTDAVLTLVSTADPHRFCRENVLLARELASRAAVSLENARLLSEALEAVRARDDFLAVAAHELRTPLTSLLLQVQMLQRAANFGRPECALTGRTIRSVESQAQRLSVLIDRLLDVARLASGRMVIRFEETDLVQVVRGALSTLGNELERAGCRLLLRLPERATGKWDAVRIEQVVTNLLSNAVKFGAGKPIEVSLDVAPGSVRIAVRDHGIGLSPEDQSRIFGRFERAVSARHFGGLGLGLYISLQIVRAHQGSLCVESEPGKGARFIVDLPRDLEVSPAVEAPCTENRDRSQI